MISVAGLEFGICKSLGFAPVSWAQTQLAFCILTASETGLLLVVKLKCNVVIMPAGVRIMHH